MAQKMKEDTLSKRVIEKRGLLSRGRWLISALYLVEQIWPLFWYFINTTTWADTSLHLLLLKSSMDERFSIDQCIIGKTLFTTSSPPHFRCFYNNDNIILFIAMKQVNVESFVKCRQMLFVDKCIRNGGDNVLKVCPVFPLLYSHVSVSTNRSSHH